MAAHDDKQKLTPPTHVSVLESIGRFFDKFLPLEIRESDIESHRKGRLLLGISFGLIVLCILGILSNPQPITHPVNIILVFAGGLYFLNIVLLHVTRSHKLPSILLCLYMSSIVGYTGFAERGVHQDPFYWNAYVPLLAIFLVGMRWGLIFSFMIGLELVAFYFFSLKTLPVNTLATASSQIFVVAFFVGFAVFLGWLYESSREKALKALEDSHRENKQIMAARDAAELANKAKSEFLATMSHELRTPLNAIIGYSEMLQEDIFDCEPDEIVPDLQKIHAAGGHLLALINDVLDLSKIEAGKMELDIEGFSVDELIFSIQDSVGSLVAKNENVLIVECDENIGTVFTDRLKIRQCLLNLLGNACKFVSKGTITLRVRRLTIGTEEYIEFQVEDTGIGMSKKQVDNLFQKFVQGDRSTTRKYGGTGLGLAITQKLCELMGGHITAKSQEGVGSIFTIQIPGQARFVELDSADSLPLVQALRDSRDSLPQVEHNEDNRTVLVIDDDPAVLDLMTRFLTKEGFRVVSSSSGKEGLRIAKELRPFAITLDVQMPGMDGWSVLGALKEIPELRETPVIMMTIVDDIRRGYALGATEFLTKPIDRSRVLEVLHKYNPLTGSGDVLIVEDDNSSRELLSKCLTKDGWTVREALNGAVALEQVSMQTPDVILLDLMMPEMDGFQFLHNLRAQEEMRAVPVIVITAKELSTKERQLLHGSVEEILQKGGYQRDKLLEEVRQLVHHRLRIPKSKREQFT